MSMLDESALFRKRRPETRVGGKLSLVHYLEMGAVVALICGGAALAINNWGEIFRVVRIALHGGE